jgi:hypothetical protein
MNEVWYWEVRRRFEICSQTWKNKGYFITLIMLFVDPCIIV